MSGPGRQRRNPLRPRAFSIIVFDAETETLRQQRRGVEQRLRPLRPARGPRRDQAGIDGGVDQAAGALHAGPVHDVVAGEDPPLWRQLIADLDGDLRHRGEAGLRIVADIARQRQESARRSRDDAADIRGVRATDRSRVEVDAERHRAAPIHRPFVPLPFAGDAEIDAVKVARRVEGVGRGDRAQADGVHRDGNRQFVLGVQIAIADQCVEALAAPCSGVLAVQRAGPEQAGGFVHRDRAREKAGIGAQRGVLPIGQGAEERLRENGMGVGIGGEAGRCALQVEEAHFDALAVLRIEPVSRPHPAARSPAAVDGGIPEQHRSGRQTEHAGLRQRRAGRARGDQRRQPVALHGPGEVLDFGPEQAAGIRDPGRGLHDRQVRRCGQRHGGEQRRAAYRRHRCRPETCATHAVSFRSNEARPARARQALVRSRVPLCRETLGLLPQGTAPRDAARHVSIIE